MHPRAAELIATLGLLPHPEGGYYGEVFRSRSVVHPDDERPARPALTTIYFLLPAGEVSRWHRVLSDEVWHYYEGDPLELWLADEPLTRVACQRLGPVDLDAQPVRIAAARQWQAARSTGAYTLVGCTVGPGFEFADFTLLRDLPSLAEAARARHPHAALFI